MLALLRRLCCYIQKRAFLLSLLFIIETFNCATSKRYSFAGHSVRATQYKYCTFVQNHQIRRLKHDKFDACEYRTTPNNLDQNQFKQSFTILCGIKGFRAWFESAFPTSMVTADVPFTKPGYTANGQKRRIVTPKIKDYHKSSLPQIYDHVLVDANQYLHSTLRRAYNRNVKKRVRNDQTKDLDQGLLDDDTLELSLVYFFRELENLVTSIAIPRKSIVIALDGSPGAAKLDIQRQRRFGIYRKAETQRKQISILRERGWTDNDFGISSSSNIKGIENIIFAKHDREQTSLNISPGTAYMDRVTNTILYWAWLSMCKRNWPMASGDGSSDHVKIYISPASVPGEGEVKLLDWMMRGKSSTKKGDNSSLVKMGESVAIIGGDSDLVLMGLVVPPTITHNINILLPRELKKTSFYVASTWDATKMLAKYMTGEKIYNNPGVKRKRKLPSNGAITLDVMTNVKLDAVMLIILNGNDYLPKARGVSGGFDSFFETYFKLVKTRMKKEDSNIGSFIINIDSKNRMSMNVPFALKYFRAMLKYEPPEMMRLIEEGEGTDFSQYQLGFLHNLCEAKMLPNPLEIQTFQQGDTSHFESELSKLNSKLKSKTQTSIRDVYGEEIEIVRMTLGNCNDTESEWNTTILGESDGHGVVSRMIPEDENKGRSYLFEVPHRHGGPLSETKKRLASLALSEIFGKENMHLFGIGFSDIDEVEENSKVPEKVQRADVKSYLAGLLWTLETYSNGHCPDWGYNYGQRCAPAVFEIVQYLESVSKDGLSSLYRTDLVKDTTMPPLPDGLTCLAALPPKAWHLVPEPYSYLLRPPVNFEELYTSCIDPATTVFDMEKFQKLCASYLKSVAVTLPNGNLSHSDTEAKGERNIYTGSKYWTVISRSTAPLKHPFTPPQPYTSRAQPLRSNRRVKATKLTVGHTTKYHKSKLIDQP